MTTATNASAEKSPSAFRTISEVAQELSVPQHVLRFWESKFTQVKPLKRGGGRRYYRPEDIVLLKRIHTLLYGEGYTIKGVQKLLKGQSRAAIISNDASPAEEEALSRVGLSKQQKETLSDILTDLKDMRQLLKGRG